MIELAGRLAVGIGLAGGLPVGIRGVRAVVAYGDLPVLEAAIIATEWTPP